MKTPNVESDPYVTGVQNIPLTATIGPVYPDVWKIGILKTSESILECFEG